MSLAKVHSFILFRFSQKISGNCCFTARLNHDGKISCDRRSNSKSESHDGKGDGTAPLRGGTAHHRAEDHGDSQDVPIGEESKVIVFDGKTPPEGLRKERNSI